MARPDVDAINGDTATRDVVKAWDQLRNGALATASTAKQRNNLARCRSEANVVQHREASTVAKADVLELHPALEMRQGTGLRGILDVWDGIENFKETFSPGLTERDHAGQPAQPPERLGELGQIARGRD